MMDYRGARTLSFFGRFGILSAISRTHTNRTEHVSRAIQLISVDERISATDGRRANERREARFRNGHWPVWIPPGFENAGSLALAELLARLVRVNDKG